MACEGSGRAACSTLLPSRDKRVARMDWTNRASSVSFLGGRRAPVWRSCPPTPGEKGGVRGQNGQYGQSFFRRQRSIRGLPPENRQRWRALGRRRVTAKNRPGRRDHVQAASVGAQRRDVRRIREREAGVSRSGSGLLCIEEVVPPREAGPLSSGPGLLRIEEVVPPREAGPLSSGPGLLRVEEVVPRREEVALPSGPGLPRVEEVAPPSGHALPRWGHALPRVEEVAPPSGHALPRSGHALPRVEEVAPPSGHALPRSGHALPRVEEVAPPSGQALPRPTRSRNPSVRSSPASCRGWLSSVGAPTWVAFASPELPVRPGFEPETRARAGYDSRRCSADCGVLATKVEET